MSQDLEQQLRGELDRRTEGLAGSRGDLTAVVMAGRRIQVRRRTGLMASALLLASAVAVVAVAVRGGTAPDVDPVSPGVQRAVCAPKSVGRLPLPSSGVLREGAVEAVLCPINGASWQAPGDALTVGVDELIRLINSRPAVRLDRPGSPVGLGCRSDHPVNDYAMTFTYPGGATSAVWGELCLGILRTGGSAPRAQASTVLSDYTDALVRQRAAQIPPARNQPVACPRFEGSLGESILPPSSQLDLQRAVVCTYRWTMVGSPGSDEFSFVRTARAPLTAVAVAGLNAGFSRNAIETHPAYDTGKELRTITGITPWGDRVFLELLNGQLVRSPAPQESSTTSVGWVLSPDERALLFGE